MSRGTWDDFSSKWGFSEGATLQGSDLRARSELVELLNRNPVMQQAKLRAVGYDRPGLHNSCMIVILPLRGNSDEELLRLWFRQQICEQELPAGLDVDELIDSAYVE